MCLNHKNLGKESGKKCKKTFCTLPEGWKLQMVNAAIKDIERAEFIAVDLEFSGLFREPIRHVAMQKYFEDCVAAVKEFLAIQLGICPVWRSLGDIDYQSRTGKQGNEDVWCMAPYNFHVFPSDRKIFSADSLTISWLLENGFSFDDWVSNGFDYARLALLQHAEKQLNRSSKYSLNLENIRDEGLQRIVAAVIENEKPVVVHNGLLDMLHLHDKFIDSLPVSIAEFCHDWIKIFTGGVYDTKHIATEGKYSILHLSDDKSTMLNELYRHLHQLNKCKSHMCLAPRHFFHASIEETATSPFKMTGNYSLTPLPEGHADSKCHEAGYDAMITAQVFLMENELYHRAADPHNLNDTFCPKIPFDWKNSSCFGSLFNNVVELVRIAPGKIDLATLARDYEIKTSQISDASLFRQSPQRHNNNQKMKYGHLGAQSKIESEFALPMTRPVKKRRKEEEIQQGNLPENVTNITQGTNRTARTDEAYNLSLRDKNIKSESPIAAPMAEEDNSRSESSSNSSERQETSEYVFYDFDEPEFPEPDDKSIRVIPEWKRNEEKSLTTGSEISTSLLGRKNKISSRIQAAIKDAEHRMSVIGTKESGKRASKITEEETVADVTCDNTLGLSPKGKQELKFYNYSWGKNNPHREYNVLEYMQAVNSRFLSNQKGQLLPNPLSQRVQVLHPNLQLLNTHNLKNTKRLSSNPSSSSSSSSTWAMPLRKHLSRLTNCNSLGTSRYFSKWPYGNSIVTASSLASPRQHIFPNQSLDLTKKNTKKK